MGNFWTPKNIFKGTNADGSKFTVKEWEWGSIGGGVPGLGGFVGMILMLMFTSIVAPLMLVFSLFSYKGKLQITSAIGIIVGLYFLYDANHFWLSSNFNAIIFGSNFVAWCVALTTASVICHILLLLLTLITRGGFYSSDNKINEKNGGVLILILGIIFISICFIALDKSKKHGTYDEIERNEIAIKKTEDSISTLDYDEYNDDNYEKQLIKGGESPEEAHRRSHDL